MMFVHMDEAYMLNTIKQLIDGKALGEDKISTIKDAADFVWKALTINFKSSLRYRRITPSNVIIVFI